METHFHFTEHAETSDGRCFTEIERKIVRDKQKIHLEQRMYQIQTLALIARNVLLITEEERNKLLDTLLFDDIPYLV